MDVDSERRPVIMLHYRNLDVKMVNTHTHKKIIMQKLRHLFILSFNLESTHFIHNVLYHSEI